MDQNDIVSLDRIGFAQQVLGGHGFEENRHSGQIVNGVRDTRER